MRKSLLTLLFFILSLVKIFSQTYSITRGLTIAEITGTPTAITGLGDDNSVGPFNIGFDFTFFGTTQTQFYVGSNGMVSFGTGYSDGSMSIPSTSTPNNTIALGVSDLHCGRTSPSATINYFVSGTAPNRILVINFKNVQHYNSATNLTNVQLQLYEGTTGNIEMHIANLVSGGNNRTIGVENAGGTVGVTQASINSSSTINIANEMIRFTPAALPPDINIKGNAVSIVNNDITPSTADHTEFGAADISTGIIIRTFTIENTASPTLTLTGSPVVNITGLNASDFTVTTVPSTTITGLNSTTFQVTFDPSTAGVKQATISIASNDADENPYTFAIYGIGYSGSSSPFITRWNLVASGSGSTQLSFGVATAGTVNYTWTQIGGAGASGSGTFSGTTATITGLPASGLIDLSIEPTNFQRININAGSEYLRLIDIKLWGSTNWTSMQNAFYGCYNLNITASDIPNLSGVTNASNMFRACISLNSPTNINSWNTSTITDMSYMFHGASAFNQNISSWNTAAVTNMSYMFFSGSPSVFNQNIGSWNTAAVNNMSNMFNGASAFNQNIGTWNTSSVTNMSSMFQWTSFNPNIGSWNTASVTNMAGMFSNTINFNQNISSWNTAAVTNMSFMFSSATNFNQNISTWNTAAVTGMSSMFNGASAFNQNISTWNTAAVTNMNDLFRDATAFNQNIGAWNIANATLMLNIFNNSGININNYDAILTAWNTAGYTNKNLANVSPLKYCAAATARTTLTTPVASGGKGWIITGDAVCAPEINLKGSNVSIVSGDITPSTGDHTDFGSIVSSFGTVVRTFTIENLGSVALALSGTPIVNITGANAADFTVTVLPSNPVAIAGSTTFQVSFAPTVTGLRTATISIANNDSNENPYTFAIQGTGLAPVVNPFITRWNLATAGSGANQILFYSATSGSVSYTWQEVGGGGASGSGVFSGFPFAVTGLPTGATIDLSISSTNLQTFYFNSLADKSRLIDVKQWGGVAWTSMGGAFDGCNNLNISATDIPNLSGVSSLTNMFKNCTSLNSPTNIGSWNTATITNMLGVFNGATAFNQNIGSWNTLAVTNMSYMFSGATVFNQNIGSWNTGAVTNMSYMFEKASVFNQNIGSWNTAVVTNMTGLFYLASAFNQNISSWNTGAVTNMSYLFWFATAFNQDIGSWNTAAVTNMNGMFQSAYAFNQNIGTWNTVAVTNMSSMFNLAIAFNQNVSTWNINNVTSMLAIFNGSGINVSNYDAMLTTWSTSSYTNKNLGNAFPLVYCSATAARTILTTPVASGGKGWTITGDVLCTPEINLKGNGISISNGFSPPTPVDHRDFGSVLESSGTMVRTFTIENLGAATLNLSGSPLVSVTGTNASDFTLTVVPSTTVAGYGSTTFQITFDPSAVGSRSATINIPNNDSNENPYTFAVRGNGMAVVEPEMNIVANGFSIVNGGFDGSIGINPFNYTDFGSVLTSAGITTRTFTVENLGIANLLLSGSPVVSITGANASDFTLTVVPSTTIVPAGSTTFQITFDPSAVGSRTATISIANNDATENPYTFPIRGNGANSTDLFVTRWNLATAGSGATQLNCGFLTFSGTANYTWQEVGGGGASGSGTLSSSSTPIITGLPSGAIIDLSFGPTNISFIRINNTTEYSRLTDVKQWGTVGWTTMASAFSDCNNLNISATDVPNLSNVTQMSSMFYGCSILNGPANINSWNTSTVTNMSVMFYNAFAFNQNISSWNTGAVTSMSSMFQSAPFNQNISSWNTSAVTQMGGMFLNCTSFNQNIGAWNINNVTSMSNIFSGSGISVGNYDAILTAWNTAGYTNKNLGNASPLKYCATAVRTTLTTAIASGGKGWTITGDALNSTCTPEINVKGNGVDIASYDYSPSIADHTDFGSINVSSGTQVRTFTIENLGNSTLQLYNSGSGTQVMKVLGANSGDFTVSTLPSFSIAGNSSTTFQVTFNPSAIGLRTATIQFDNSDATENPYAFSIQGTGVETEIDIKGNATSITSGDITPSTADHTDFGQINIVSATMVRTFTIENLGNEALSLSGSPLVSITGINASDFTLTTLPTTPVTVSGSTTFQITFDPSAGGSRTATLSIANNDADENPYTFAIQGTGTLLCLLNTSQSSGNWGTAGIWSCGHIPLATEPVQISSGHTITLDVNGTAKSLDLRGTFNKQTTKVLLIQGN